MIFNMIFILWLHKNLNLTEIQTFAPHIHSSYILKPTSFQESQYALTFLLMNLICGKFWKTFFKI